MKKQALTWSVAELHERYATINFPEYQREPSVWSRSAKQRLIDSMLRQFDIASLYVYDNGDGTLDCIDGRQRIGAIMAFLGSSPDDDDNGFEVRAQNEIYVDVKAPYAALDDVCYRDILDLSKKRGEKQALAKGFISEFMEYSLTIVKLSDSKQPEEFNLQFTRLNLGTIINSGEKLHAMVGEMRDACFGKGGLGGHPFLEEVSIPTRRYSREQVAAQVLAQVFARNETHELARTRHFDLQRLFKEKATLTPSERTWILETRDTMSVLHKAFAGREILRNRAMTVSTVLLAQKLGIETVAEGKRFVSFVEEFLCRLKWQIGKGLDVDPEYRYLTDFQRHVTQASVEKPAVKAREVTLEREYGLWRKTGLLTGDKKYTARTGSDPSTECRG